MADLGIWRVRRRRLLDLLSVPSEAGEDQILGKKLDEIDLNPGEHKNDLDEISRLRFGSKDLKVRGTLATGQFGTVELVYCRSNKSIYVHKTISKKVAFRNRHQCFPHIELEILRLASLRPTLSHHIPHLLSSFQSPTSLHLVMTYASSGTLFDALESAGSIKESDLKWWTAQAVNAIQWCHQQGFVHRDIKPQNFAITGDSHLLLIDFGSAARLLPPLRSSDTSSFPSTSSRKPQLVDPEYCRAPCGTCDYIAPEILQYHERAMVKFEMGLDSLSSVPSPEGQKGEESLVQDGEECYGWEVDWWSLGVTMYELAIGVAPFFAEDIRGTYLRILGHDTSLNLRVLKDEGYSDEFVALLSRFLAPSSTRLGRLGASEVKSHPWFGSLDFESLHEQFPPDQLHLPQFSYSSSPTGWLKTPATLIRSTTSKHGHSRSRSRVIKFDFELEGEDADDSKPFAFSQHFVSSAVTGGMETTIMAESRGSASSVPSFFHDSTPGPGGGADAETEGRLRQFVGFTWGPVEDAFDGVPGHSEEEKENILNEQAADKLETPKPMSKIASSTPFQHPPSGIKASAHRFVTPLRGILRSTTHPLNTPHPPVNPPTHARTLTIPRHHHPPGTGTVRRTYNSNTVERPMTDRQAMKELVHCIGMSARKKVMESGRKPRSLSLIFKEENSTAAKDPPNGKKKRIKLGRRLSFGQSPRHGTLEDTDESSTSAASSPEDQTKVPSQRQGLTIVPPALALRDRLVGGGDDDLTMHENPHLASPSPRPGSAMELSKRSRAGTPTLWGFPGFQSNSLSSGGHSQTYTITRDVSKNSSRTQTRKTSRLNGRSDDDTTSRVDGGAKSLRKSQSQTVLSSNQGGNAASSRMADSHATPRMGLGIVGFRDASVSHDVSRRNAAKTPEASSKMRRLLTPYHHPPPDSSGSSTELSSSSTVHEHDPSLHLSLSAPLPQIEHSVEVSRPTTQSMASSGAMRKLESRLSRLMMEVQGIENSLQLVGWEMKSLNQRDEGVVFG
ncbi:kinase-like protein [Sistotremastrum suecicum HHB10207 ss-3]|uniref:Kinase-like protein n=1 Tax=Sistotremastrum suecicum HHB10207 ss-3 TaxID=1314776 RepID=A0A166FUN9_9AGAM|nr:kinase-like protein [Sistotremastrum suecicum HHB10207 ss-3]